MQAAQEQEQPNPDGRAGAEANADSGTGPDPEAEFLKLRSKWSIYRPHELKERCEQRGGERYLIDGLISGRSLGLLVGDSGLGKSPLAYQMAICVAAGVPFLGFPVQQARVLCLDYENGLSDANDLIARLSIHLGLAQAPKDLVLWNGNDCDATWGQPGHTFMELIRDVKPGLVFIDPISALLPDIEKNNTDATKGYQLLRKLISDLGCSIVNLHHRRKPGKRDPFVSLEDSNFRAWFTDARGAGVLVNGADVRLGVDRPGDSSVLKPGKEELALVVRGYARVRGEIPTLHLARVFGADGEPQGYRKASGVELLSNSEQEGVFLKLPDRFEFKDAMRAYGKKDQATKDFLDKCIAKSILRKVARGLYEKVKVAE